MSVLRNELNDIQWTLLVFVVYKKNIIENASVGWFLSINTE